MKKLKPLQQGQLDSLCGIYAIINGIRYALRSSKKNRHNLAEKLFTKIIETLGKRHRCAFIALDGSCYSEMKRFLRYAKDFLRSKYGLSLEYKQLYKNKEISLKDFLTQCHEFAQSEHCAVILSLEGHHCHWTIFQELTKHRVILFDSDGLAYLPTKHIAPYRKGIKARHYLDIKNTIFLTINPKENLNASNN